jgi:hypothetical protein
MKGLSHRSTAHPHLPGQMLLRQPLSRIETTRKNGRLQMLINLLSNGDTIPLIGSL